VHIINPDIKINNCTAANKAPFLLVQNKFWFLFFISAIDNCDRCQSKDCSGDVVSLFSCDCLRDLIGSTCDTS